MIITVDAPGSHTPSAKIYNKHGDVDGTLPAIVLVEGEKHSCFSEHGNFLVFHNLVRTNVEKLPLSTEWDATTKHRLRVLISKFAQGDITPDETLEKDNLQNLKWNKIDVPARTYDEIIRETEQYEATMNLLEAMDRLVKSKHGR